MVLNKQHSSADQDTFHFVSLFTNFLLPGISRQQTIFLSDLRFFVQWFHGSMFNQSVTAALCSQRFA